VRVPTCLPWGNHQLSVSTLVVRSRSVPTNLCAVSREVTHNGFSRLRWCSVPAQLEYRTFIEDLNNIVGQGIWYNTFQVQNTEWLWWMNNIVINLNSDNMLSGSFGLYPSYVAGILNSVKEIHFYVLFNKQVDYAECIEKYIVGKVCSVSYKSHTAYYFHFSSSSGNTVTISFKGIRFSELPSELIFAQSVLKRICLSSLVYGIVCIKKRVTYITN